VWVGWEFEKCCGCGSEPFFNDAKLHPQYYLHYPCFNQLYDIVKILIESRFFLCLGFIVDCVYFDKLSANKPF